MLRPTLPTVLTVALWTAVLATNPNLVGAQEKADPSKAGKPAGAAQTPPKPADTKPTVPATPPRPADPNIVGTVNGKNILFTDVIARLKRDSPDGFRAAAAQVAGPAAAAQLFGDDPKASVTLTADEVIALLRDKPTQAIFTTFQRMLQSEAILQAAAKENITVADPQVEDYITKLLTNLRKNGRIPAGMTDDQFLASQKISRGALVEEFRPQVALDKLKEKDVDLQKLLTKTVEQNVGHKVTEDDYLKARHILIMTTNTQSANPADVKATDAAALAKINKIAAEIKAGKKTFDAAAKESSEDPGSKAQGGDLGIFMRGMMVPEFDKAAFAGKPGTLIGPIKSQFGYHLIQIEKTGKELTPEQRKEALSQQYQRAEQQNQQVVSDFMRNLMEKKVQIASFMTPPAQPNPGFPPGAQGG